MGADLILATIWIEKDQPLPIDKTINHLATVIHNETDLDLLNDAAQFVGITIPDEYATLADLIRQSDPEADMAWRNQIVEGYRKELEKFTETLNYRDVNSFDIGNLAMYITGGMSWGDDPSDTYSQWHRLFLDEYEPGWGNNPYCNEIYDNMFVMPAENWVRPGSTARVVKTEIVEVTREPNKKTAAA